jgi:hypothetical protein
MPEYAHPLTPIPGFSRYAPYISSSLGDIGDMSDPTSIAAIAAQGAATTGGILAGLAGMGAILPEFALAGPIGAAIAGLTAVGIAIAGVFSGCGQTCVQATQDANTVEAYLAQNLHHYLDAPVHYRSLQLAAINNFNTAWNALVKACSDPTLGTAGVNCIHNRQEGSCDFHNGPDGWGTGPCWNWWIGYLDPIRNDPNVVPDPPPPGQLDTSAPPTVSVMNPDGTISVVSAAAYQQQQQAASGGVIGSANMKPLLIGGALIVAALVLGGGN